MVVVGLSDQMDETLVWPMAMTPRLSKVYDLINTRQANLLTLELENVAWRETAPESSMAAAAEATKAEALRQALENINDAD